MEKQIHVLGNGDLPLGDRTNMVYMGTSVSAGRGLAVVVATGMSTEIDRIASLLQEAETGETTPLQQSLAVFGRFLVWITLGVVGLLFLLGVLRGLPLVDLVLFAVSLAVAAVPEGLPAVVTIALALGVQRMARKRSLVRKLAAVETLGCASVICTDKTGTLTVGEMTVRTIVACGQAYAVRGEGYAPMGTIERGGAPIGLEDLARLREVATVFGGCNGARIVEEGGAWRVNDAPAIKGADIGVAMGRTGTEVTKEASDMVITDDNFATIVAAVEEGRGIYANIRKTLQYLLAGNAGEILVMAAAILAGLPLPLLPIQLLWINLVTDGFPALCLATDPLDPDVMRRRPRAKGERLTDRAFLRLVGFSGILTAATTFGVYLATLTTESDEMAQAHAFTSLVFVEIFKAFVFRSDTKTVWQVGLASNLRLVGVAALTILLQMAAPGVGFLGGFLGVPPMPMTHTAVLLAVALIPPTILEVLKILAWRARGRSIPPAERPALPERDRSSN